MGVLYDYFRAADPATAAKVMELPAGPLVPTEDAGPPPFDGVDAKDINPVIHLGRLVAIVRGEPWEVDTVTSTSVWPPPDTAPVSPEQAEELPEDSPWFTGPWAEQLDLTTRDTLADIDDSRHREFAVQWSQIEEFAHYSDVSHDEMATLVADLTGLARRARDAGQQLYCLSCM